METLLRKYLWGVDLVVIAHLRGVQRARDRDPDRGRHGQRRRRRPPCAAASAAGPPPPRRRPTRKEVEHDPQAQHLLLDLPADPRGRTPRRQRPAAARRRCSGPTCRSSCWRSCTRRRRPIRAGRWRSSATTTSKTRRALRRRRRRSARRRSTDIEEDARLSRLRRRAARVPGAARARRRRRRGAAVAAAPPPSSDPLAAELDKRDQEDGRAQLRGAARRPSTRCWGT